MTTNNTVRDVISGTAIALNGDDIDTDRIIPAKFLKELTFDALGQHAFAGDRANAAEGGTVHPFDDPVHSGAKVLLVGRNFGCGSSREHAPQALNRWGIQAIVGMSFGEIFRGNAATIGLPCLTVEDTSAARAEVERDPRAQVTVDLRTLSLHVGTSSWPTAINETLRQQFLDGNWDTISLLGSARDEVRATHDRLPYLHRWQPTAARA